MGHTCDFFFTALLTYNWNNMYLCKVYNLSSDICLHPGAITTIKIRTISIISKNFFLPLGNPSLFLHAYPHPWQSLICFVTIDEFVVLKILLKWNQARGTLPPPPPPPASFIHCNHWDWPRSLFSFFLAYREIWTNFLASPVFWGSSCCISSSKVLNSMENSGSILWLYHNLSVHSPVDGHLSFHVFVVTSKALGLHV